MEGSPHSLLKPLLRIDDIGSCPELDLSQNLAGFYETLSVLTFENSSAMHCCHGAKTKPDQGHSSPFEKFRFEQEYRQHTPRESCLVVGKNVLLLSCVEQVREIQH